MLLIQSDMFKALWFMVYPIVTFTSGRPSSHSTFCQVNGFFLSIGIEASGTYLSQEISPRIADMNRLLRSHDRNPFCLIHLQAEQCR